MASRISYLIISIDSDDWLKIEDKIKEIGPKKFFLIIVKKDDERPIKGCKPLCKEATYAQRSYELFIKGKEIGLPKIANLGYSENMEVTKLIAQLQLQIMLGGISHVFVSNNPVLVTIMNSIKKSYDSVNISYIG